MKNNSSVLLIILFIGFFKIGIAQTTISETEAIDLALKNYPLISAADKKIEQQKTLLPSYLNLPNTEVLIQAPTGDAMRASVLQMMDFPTVYVAQKKSLKAQVAIAEAEKGTNVNLLKYNVKVVFNNLQFAIEKEKTLKRFDSILSEIQQVNEVRYKVGQIALLEKVNGEAKYKFVQNQFFQSQTDRKNSQFQLSLYLGKPGDSTFVPNATFAKSKVPVAINFKDNLVAQNPILSLYRKQIDFSKTMLKVERNRAIPGLMFGYFNQSTTTETFYKLNYGFTVPIAFWFYRAKIKAAKKGVELAESQSAVVQNKLYSDFILAQSQYKQFAQSLDYFETIGVVQSKQIIETAQKSFKSGAISYYIYLQNIEQAFQIDLGYLDAIKNYNQSVYNLLYIKGEL